MASAFGTKWLVEDELEGVAQVLAITDTFYSGKSDFQSIEVIDCAFGRTLVLDGKIQSAEADEAVYHESLVQPALLAQGNPKSVYIGGGGEGATAREVLRFKSVEKVVMVDIDPVVCATSKQYLQQHHAGAFDDPRFELVVDDCLKILKERDEKYDVLIMDLADPLVGGPCWQLYTQSFYQFCLTKLNPGGVLVTQSGPAGILTCKDVFTPINYTLKTVFPRVECYASHILSFTDLYAFNIGFKDAEGASWAQTSPEDVDKAIAEKVSGENRFYDGETHRRIFSLAKYQRKALSEETRVITKDAAVFIYSATTAIAEQKE